MLAQASLLPKAAETGKDNATSALARLPVREPSLPLLAGGSAGRRLALAGRRLPTRCRGGLQTWWPALALPDEGILRTPHLTGSGRLLMARRRLVGYC
jgi:hypothetical protein